MLLQPCSPEAHDNSGLGFLDAANLKLKAKSPRSVGVPNLTLYLHTAGSVMWHKLQISLGLEDVPCSFDVSLRPTEMASCARASKLKSRPGIGAPLCLCGYSIV